MSTYLFMISIILVVVISASLLIVLIYTLRPKKKSKKMLSDFLKTADEFDLFIGKYEVLNDGVIGMDEINDKVLFQKTSKGKQHGVVVDLKDVKTCSVRKTFTPRKLNKSAAVKTITLQLNFKNGIKPIFLPFYNSEIGAISEIEESVKQAKKWQRLLSAMILKQDTNISMLQKTA